LHDAARLSCVVPLAVLETTALQHRGGWASGGHAQSLCVLPSQACLRRGSQPSSQRTPPDQLRTAPLQRAGGSELLWTPGQSARHNNTRSRQRAVSATPGRPACCARDFFDRFSLLLPPPSPCVSATMLRHSGRALRQLAASRGLASEAPFSAAAPLAARPDAAQPRWLAELGVVRNDWTCVCGRAR